MKARKVPVVIVGNKSDKKKERAVSRREGSALAKELGCTFFEVSAQGYQEVENVFYDVARRLQWQRQHGGSKRNCGFWLTGCSAIRQFSTWLFS